MPDSSKLDTLLAIKAIGLCPGLSANEIRIGIILVEHFNRRTADCYPGEERLARLTQCNVRTVIRAIRALSEAGLFRCIRHGGPSQRNRYEPVWERFRELLTDWQKRFREGR